MSPGGGSRVGVHVCLSGRPAYQVSTGCLAGARLSFDGCHYVPWHGVDTGKFLANELCAAAVQAGGTL